MRFLDAALAARMPTMTRVVLQPSVETLGFGEGDCRRKYANQQAKGMMQAPTA